jgi:hypothetical protein
MRATIIIAAFFVAAAAAIAAAPGQTVRPGELTRADVWVQNADSQPVPIRVHQARSEPPIRVLIANGDPSVGATPPVPVRLSPTTWAYRMITIKAADDPAVVLANPGFEGWDVTGLAWPTTDGTRLLLKRPR